VDLAGHRLVLSGGEHEAPGQTGWSGGCDSTPASQLGSRDEENASALYESNVLYGTVRERSGFSFDLSTVLPGGYSTSPAEEFEARMEHAVEKIEPSGRPESSESVPASEVQRTLSAILQSTYFQSSKQSQELLKYIVDQTLAGHLEMLKERIIGANVFSRRPDYDTNDDPIVRARAAEVRKRLALFYQAAREEAVLISVPSGSFRATLEWAGKSAIQPPPVPLPVLETTQPALEAARVPAPRQPEKPESPTSATKSRSRRWLILIVAFVVLLAWAAQHFLSSSGERAFNQFWSPVFDSSHPTLIYVGCNAVYELSSAYVDGYYKQHPRSRNEEMGMESYIPLTEGTKIDVQDLFPAKDTFVTIGDVAATTKIVSLLDHRNKQFDIRFGNDVAYGDLRENPTILIGAHNNAWTLTMTENLRYAFDGHTGIVDRSDPKRHWSATTDFAEDYAIISRVLSSRTGTTVITAAGVGHAGTRAAAEFLTTPQSISALAKTLPQGWEKKNLQIVLHTTVINQLPSAPEVVAVYSW
jgi:hypothetical protein